MKNIVASWNNRVVMCENTGEQLRVVAPQASENAFLSFEISFANVTAEDYLLLPACAYHANAYHAKPMEYPSIFTREEAKIDMPITLAGVPRLNPDGSGCLSVTTGDLSVPCAALFCRAAKKAYFWFTMQSYRDLNLGFSYQLGKLTLQCPANRGGSYPYLRHYDTGLSVEKGEEINIPHRFYSFDCADMAAFYARFFELRKCMQLPAAYSQTLKVAEAWKIHEEKFNRDNYNANMKTYTVGTEYGHEFWDKYQVWQPGWTGGAISSYPLMKCGNAQSYARGKDTLDFLFKTQQPSGFFIGLIDETLQYFGDGFDTPATHDYHMVRKSADVLYFAFKHFDVMQEKRDVIPSAWLAGIQNLADAFVRLWERYGQIGQFVSHTTGELIVGGSTAGALVPAGLLRAAEWFECPQYAEIAKKIARQYLVRDLENGYTGGGPGEIMQAPDSESAFLLLESFVALYVATKAEEWLCAAKFAAQMASSWVVAYNYTFPPQSEFARLDIKTIGSVFANVQNKHSAPGICTLSGDSLYKLYQYTQDVRYLELLLDIAGNIFQYISTEHRPIYSRDVPARKSPSGYINERVNMSDWEGKENVGSILYGSTWAETSSMLIIAELGDLLEEQLGL